MVGWTALLAAVVGYLAGSISFSRVIAGFADPNVDLSEPVEIDVPESDSTYEVDFVSPTAVSLRLGPRSLRYNITSLVPKCPTSW